MIDYKFKFRKKRTKKTLEHETKTVVRSLIITLSIMIAVLAAVLLATTNQSAQKGYALQQAKLKNEELKTINNGLHTKITNSTTFSKIEDSDLLNAMSEPQSKNYITEDDNRVF